MSKNTEVRSVGQGAGSGPLAERLQELASGLLRTKHVHYAIVAVESGDRSLRWIGAAGMADADGTPMRPDTPFWIASVTKLYIAATILRLHEQKRLSIDDAMAAYLPQRLIEGLHRTRDGVDHTGKITIRHLLGHASGLPDYLEIHPKGEKSAFDLALEGGDREVPVEDLTRIVRAVNAPLFPPQPLDRKKRKVRYSDTNFRLLIAIIETVTGQPIQDAFREMLYRPLDLRRTFHPGTEPMEAVPPVASVWYQDKPLNLPLTLRSIGDLNSTAADLLAFGRALVSGAAFDHPATFDLMRGDWQRFGFSLSPVGPGWPIEYGLGLMRFRLPRIFTPFRSVPEVIGHTGVCGSWLFYCPALDVYLAGSVSQMTAGPVPFRFIPKLLNLLETHLR